jgi:hypothetical protein
MNFYEKFERKEGCYERKEMYMRHKRVFSLREKE